MRNSTTTLLLIATGLSIVMVALEFFPAEKVKLPVAEIFDLPPLTIKESPKPERRLSEVPEPHQPPPAQEPSKKELQAREREAALRKVERARLIVEGARLIMEVRRAEMELKRAELEKVRLEREAALHRERARRLDRFIIDIENDMRRRNRL